MTHSLVIVGMLLLSAEPTGRIAFLNGTEQPDQCVALLNPATGEIQRVGQGRLDGPPAWSPDGEFLAFSTKSEKGTSIRVIKADGSEGYEIAHGKNWNRDPRWSPSGQLLAYTATDGAESRMKPEDLATGTSIAVYDFASRGESMWGGGSTGLMRPTWVTDANILAIRLVPGTDKLTTDINIVTNDAATPLPEEAKTSPGDYEEWAVEPNPKSGALFCAFESNDGGDREIYVLSTKAGAFDVSNHRAADWNPAWSPDGKWLAFESFRDGRRGIYRVYPDTLRVFPVATSPDADCWHPTWSPDGKWIAYVSDKTGAPELHATEIDSGESRQLTNGGNRNLAPAWRPEGGK